MTASVKIAPCIRIAYLRILMNLLFLFAKVTLVAFFLLMFLRSNKVIWGIGLLTVTSAILLDAFLNTFGREEMIQQFGFFYYVLAGALFAGATLWLWGVLRAYTKPVIQEPESIRPTASPPACVDAQPAEGSDDRSQEKAAYSDIYVTINDNFSEDDILDLEFDMGYSEYSNLIAGREIEELTLSIIETAERDHQIEELRLAIERVQSPLAADHLPRIEKISADSPRTVLRQYMLANCTMTDIELIIDNLRIDSDSVPGDTTKARVRNLLLYVDSNDRVEELIELLQRRSSETSAPLSSQ